jgi:hypothetical protein
MSCSIKFPAAITRRGVLTAGAAGAAGAVTTLVGCGNDKPRPKASGQIDKVTYVTGFNITGQDSFVFAAIEHGWYREAGLQVTVVPGVGTGGNLLRLREGQRPVRGHRRHRRPTGDREGHVHRLPAVRRDLPAERVVHHGPARTDRPGTPHRQTVTVHVVRAGLRRCSDERG